MQSQSTKPTNLYADTPEALTAAYARTSSAKQKDNASIETQIEAIGMAAQMNNGGIDRWYKDDGISGRSVPTAERPDGRRLLADVQAGKVKRLYVYKISRLGRDHADGNDVLQELRRAGVEVISLIEGTSDLSNPMGWFMTNFHSLIADLQANTQLQHSREGMDRIAREGGWLGGKAAFGYRTTGEGHRKTLVIDRQRIDDIGLAPAEIVVLIFDWAAAGESCIDIALRLNERGIPTPGQLHGRKNANTEWQPQRIWKMIKNPIYRGTRVWGRTSRSATEGDPIASNAPALVSPDLWVLANRRIVQRHWTQREKRTVPERDYHLSGLLVCGHPECGRHYNGRTARSGGSKEERWYGYYRCNGRGSRYYVTPDKQRSCTGPIVRADHAEAVIWSFVRAVLEGDEAVIERAIAAVLGRRSAALETADETLATVERERLALTERRDRLIDQLDRNLITEDDFRRRRIGLDQEGGALARREEAARSHAGGVRALHDDIAAYRQIVADTRALWARGEIDQWAAVHRLVERGVVVLDDGEPCVRIEFRHGNGATVALDGATESCTLDAFGSPLTIVNPAAASSPTSRVVTSRP